MELYSSLSSGLRMFVTSCFDRVVIHGTLSGLSRPEQVVYFFRQVVGSPALSKKVLSRRANDYLRWVEAFARNHHPPSSGPNPAGCKISGRPRPGAEKVL